MKSDFKLTSNYTRLWQKLKKPNWTLRPLSRCRNEGNWLSLPSRDRMCSHINPNLTTALPGLHRQNRPPLLIKVIHDWILYSVSRWCPVLTIRSDPTFFLWFDLYCSVLFTVLTWFGSNLENNLPVYRFYWKVSEYYFAINHSHHQLRLIREGFMEKITPLSSNHFNWIIISNNWIN